MKISFCTTCMGRLHHLMETLPKNIKDNENYHDIEFLVLDYNSPDGLESWMKKEMAGLMKDGLVTYWRERSTKRWRMPHAKNLSHLLATGDIVCNVDADNLTGNSYAARLAECFSEGTPTIVTHIHGGGFGGRIALRMPDFLKLRGYDEKLSFGWGWEDDDFKRRAVSSGLRLVPLWQPDDRAIGHDDKERIQYMPEWSTVSEAHGKQTRVFQERKPGQVINPGGFGKAVVYRGFEDTPRLVSDTVPIHQTRKATS